MRYNEMYNNVYAGDYTFGAATGYAYFFLSALTLFFSGFFGVQFLAFGPRDLASLGFPDCSSLFA